MYAAQLGTTVGEIRLSHNVPSHGVSADAPILTMKGPMAAELIAPGDRVITRNGARTVRHVEMSIVASADVICFQEEVLDPNTPIWAVHLPKDQPVLLRGWRAQALAGQPQAGIAAYDLTDGKHIREVTVDCLRLITLHFDSPEVIYAAGLELPCLAA